MEDWSRKGVAKRNWKKGKTNGWRFRNERVRKGANIIMADSQSWNFAIVEFRNGGISQWRNFAFTRVRT